MYPVMLDLRGRRCLVVGAGRIALGKITGLVAAGAALTVVAPAAVAEVERLASEGSLALQRRGYARGDLSGMRLAFAATNDPDVNLQVAADADRAGIWANVVDVPMLCAFTMPAVARSGDLEVAIGTNGAAPFAAAAVKRAMEARMGTAWGAWVESASRFRCAVRASGLSPSQQSSAFASYLDRTLDPEALEVRVVDDGEMDQILLEAGQT